MKPTTGRIRRVAATGVAAGLAVLGMAVTSPGTLAAGSIPGQPSNACSDNTGGEWIEQTIISNPVFLAFEVGDGGTQGQPFPSVENLHVAVCYSDTPGTQPSSLAGGFVTVVGPQVGNGQPTNPILGYACINDSNTVIQPQCGFNLSATITPGSGPCTACGATVAVSVPVAICIGGVIVGAHQVGTTCSGTPTLQDTVGVGATGLIVSSLTLNPGPNGTLGATSPTTTLYVDGISEPLTAGAGVGLGTVGAGTTNGANTAICLGPLGCPGAWAATSGAPLAWLVLPVVGTVPVNPVGAPNPECFEINSACPAPPYNLP